MRLLIIIAIMALGAGLSTAQHHHGSGEALKAGEIQNEHSLYHLNSDWTNHRGKTVKLSDFEGKPAIVVMFYGNCKEVCPILIQDTWRLFSALDEPQRKEVNVLAVSFDPENDTPQALRDYAEQERLNLPNWHFMTAQRAQIRSLAMMLGVQYSKKSNGHFAHSNLVTVLDRKGRIIKRVEGLDQPMKNAAATIDSTLNNAELQ